MQLTGFIYLYPRTKGNPSW